MDDIRRIDDFLKLMVAAAKSGHDIYTDRVRKNLIYLGVDDKADISSNFPLWVDKFLRVPNIDVYVNPNNNYFCKFKSSNGTFNGYSSIKLYIPVDKEHVFAGANQLFEFLVSENIPHFSKIGKRVSFDDIVVRVDTKENANKVIDFVNNNLYLRSGSLPTSPFSVKSGNVSIAWDGALSYNEVLSRWISEYINWEKNNNNLDNVNYSRFYVFIQKRIDSLFEKDFDLHSYVDELIVDGIFEEEYESSVELQLLNYYDVSCLILLSLVPKKQKQDVYMYIDKIFDDKYQMQHIDKISKLWQSGKNKDVIYTEKQKNAMKNAFSSMCKTYGYATTRKYFLDFMMCGNYNRITRNNGARKLMKDNEITKEVAVKIADEWFSKNMSIEHTMEDAFNDTYDKFDYYQIVFAVKSLFIDCDFSHITDRNGYRKKLIDEIGTSDIVLNVMEILTRSGYEIDRQTIDELCEMYMNEFDKKRGKNR